MSHLQKGWSWSEKEWFAEMGCSKFLASKQDLLWTSVFIIHFTFQTDVGFSNSLDKNQAVFVVYDLLEGWVFSSYCTGNNPLKQTRKWVFWPTYMYYVCTYIYLFLLKAFDVFLWIFMVYVALILRSWQWCLVQCVGFPALQTAALSSEINGKLCSLTWVFLLRVCVLGFLQFILFDPHPNFHIKYLNYYLCLIIKNVYLLAVSPFRYFLL